MRILSPLRYAKERESDAATIRRLQQKLSQCQAHLMAAKASLKQNEERWVLPIVQVAKTCTSVRQLTCTFTGDGAQIFPRGAQDSRCRLGDAIVQATTGPDRGNQSNADPQAQERGEVETPSCRNTIQRIRKSDIEHSRSNFKSIVKYVDDELTKCF